MTYDLRRAAGRTVTRADGRETWHSFAFGEHYDATNTSFGLLVAHNDDTLAPGAGYAVHRHRDVEIVTWVLDGELTHEDSRGRLEVVRPGWVQGLSAGRGVEHSERNEGQVPVRFVQMWLRPPSAPVESTYELREVGALLSGGGLPPVLGVGPARFHVARLGPGVPAVLPGMPYVHVYVARGGATVEGVEEVADLCAGDALRLVGVHGGSLVGRETGAELLVWAMPAT